MSSTLPEARLQRRLGPGLLTFYGIGTIVGAGIYVLVSEVARETGPSLPWAFLTAGVIAGLTGACYAELSARLPRAAGAVIYVDRAFGMSWLSIVTGLMVLLTGIVSAATITRGFVGYLALYVELPPWLAILGLCVVMGVLTSVGVRTSAWVIASITGLEVAGLLLVIAVAGTAPAQAVDVVFEPAPVAVGAFLAFYAFIGFEDMVNLAEEVRDPRRNVPRSILLAIAVSGLLYVAVAVIAVRHVELSRLAESRSPMALMVSDQPIVMQVIAVIAVIAVSNGALIQIIMASRMLYGMSRRGLAPAILGRVSPLTHTPVITTWLVTAVIATFALSLPLIALARITSAVMLLVFVLVSLSLIRLRRTPRQSEAIFRVWPGVAALSLLANLGLLGYQLWSLFST